MEPFDQEEQELMDLVEQGLLEPVTKEQEQQVLTAIRKSKENAA